MIGKILAYKMFAHPIFVVGDGRSGTSVLLQALGKHPQILAAYGEAPLITSVGGIISNFSSGSQSSMEYYARSINFKRAYLNAFLKRFCFEIAMGEHYGFKYIVKQILKKPANFVNKKYWAAKTFPPQIVAESLITLYPDAKFIYIVRNGIDVVHSKTKFHGFRKKNFEEICKTWDKNYHKYKYLETLEGSLKIYQEQLWRNTESVFKKICLTIGISYHDAPAEFVANNIIHPLDKPSRASVDAKQLISQRAPAHESWTAEQKKIFKEICADTMKANNYEIPF